MSSQRLNIVHTWKYIFTRRRQINLILTQFPHFDLGPIWDKILKDQGETSINKSSFLLGIAWKDGIPMSNFFFNFWHHYYRNHHNYHQMDCGWGYLLLHFKFSKSKPPKLSGNWVHLVLSFCLSGGKWQCFDWEDRDEEGGGVQDTFNKIFF